MTGTTSTEALTELTAAPAGSRGLDWAVAYALGLERPTDGDLPAYTTDLRAALTLVPEGLYWLAGYGREHPDEPLGGFQVFAPDGAEEPIASAEAATVELACCIASLRVRIAAEPREVSE